MVQHQFFLPAPLLRPYIVGYHLIKQEAEGNVNLAVSNMPPFPASGLCFNYVYEEPVAIVRGEKDLILPSSFVFSPITERYQVNCGRKNCTLVVQFRLGKFYEFFGWPIRLFNGQPVQLDETSLRGPFQEVLEQLRESGGMPALVQAIEQFLLQRLRKAPLPGSKLEAPLSLIACKRRHLRIGELARLAGCSPRHLRRLFGDYLGISPQAFLRIFRFYQALRLLKTGDFENLATLALESGYYDQAHFTHDFKLYAGEAPQQFLERHSALSDSLLWRETIQSK